jgi:hypothetical protein
MKKLPKDVPAGSDYRAEAVREMELLRLRVGLLEGQERLLLDMYLNQNASYYRLAALTGMGEKYVARRVQSLLRCLQSEEYLSILRHQRLFEPRALEVAYDYFLLGMSVRAISRKRNLSRYRVGKKIRRLQNWLEERQKAKGKRQKAEGRR